MYTKEPPIQHSLPNTTALVSTKAIVVRIARIRAPDVLLKSTRIDDVALRFIVAEEAAAHVRNIQASGKGTTDALGVAPNNLSEVASSILVARMLEVVFLRFLIPLPGAVEGGLNPLLRNWIHAHKIATGAHVFRMLWASIDVRERCTGDVVVPTKALGAVSLSKTIVSVNDGFLESLVVDARRHDDVLRIDSIRSRQRLGHRARSRRGHDGDETCKEDDDGGCLHVED